MLTYLFIKQVHTPMLNERVLEVFFGKPHWSDVILVAPELSIKEAFAVVEDGLLSNYDAATDADVYYKLVAQSLDA